MANSWLTRSIEKFRSLQISLPTKADLPATEEVVVGASFARFRSGDLMEIAQVLRIEENDNGIPHVRFVVTMRDRNGEYSDGPRTLGLEAFKRHFNLGARKASQEAVRWGPPTPRDKVRDAGPAPRLRWPVRGAAAGATGKVQTSGSDR